MSHYLKEEDFKIKVRPQRSSWSSLETCCLGVSVGSPNHEEKKLIRTLEWISDHFQHCIIDLSDTLQRYNYEFEGMPKEMAAWRARSEGRQWLLRNIANLSRLNISFNVVSWDHWLEHPMFQAYREGFEWCYQSDKQFREAVEHDTDKFIRRKGFCKLKDDLKAIRENSKNYLLEELAAHSLLYKDTIAANIYPGRQHECFKVVREGLIKKAPKGLENSTHLRLVYISHEYAANQNHLPKAA